MKIADFFGGGGDAKPPPAKVEPVAKVAKKTRDTLTTATPIVEKEAQMTLNLKLEKPDIILVEHMDHINTNAMILNVNSKIILYF